MNIVVVMHSHVLGGAERHVLTLLQGLRGRGHRVHFAGPLDSWLGAQLKDSNIPCLHLAMRGMYDPLSAWRLTRYLQKVGADLVHGHSMRGTRYAAWAGKLAGIAVVSTAHSTTPGRWLRHAHHILPVSSAVHRSLAAHGYDATLELPIYLGVADPRLHGPAQREAQRLGLGLNDQEMALAMVGRFVPDKGHDLALRALAQLHELPIKLFLLGDHRTAWGRQIYAQATQLGLRQRVVFLGQRNDTEQLLPAFDGLLQPSRREALSLSLLEAGAQALAIIASAVGGIPEIVAHERTGLLIPVDDSQALAAAISRLYHHPALAKTLGEQARQQFQDGFTTTRMVEQIELVYRKAVSAPSSVANDDAAAPVIALSQREAA